MYSLRKQITATSDDVLSSENIAYLDRPSAVNVYACCQTVTDRFSLQYGQNVLIPSTAANLVTDADTGPKPQDDHILVDAILPAGQRLVLPVSAVSAQIGLLITINPIR